MKYVLIIDCREDAEDIAERLRVSFGEGAGQGGDYSSMPCRMKKYAPRLQKQLQVSEGKKLPTFWLKLTGEKAAREVMEAIYDIFTTRHSARRFGRRLEKMLDKQCPNWRGAYAPYDTHDGEKL